MSFLVIRGYTISIMCRFSVTERMTTPFKFVFVEDVHLWKKASYEYHEHLINMNSNDFIAILFSFCQNLSCCGIINICCTSAFVDFFHLICDRSTKYIIIYTFIWTIYKRVIWLIKIVTWQGDQNAMSIIKIMAHLFRKSRDFSFQMHEKPIWEYDIEKYD